MKRLSSSDSLGPTDHHFRSMLEGFDEEEEEVSCHVAEKKRRLGAEQVKALEKNFEVENKLEPERKVQLARELGLQPRQVAVWFQNRRARWKTKQLERDYGVLKANYDALKLDFDSLHRDKETLLKQIKELKSKLNEDNSESDLSVKEEKASPEEDDDPLLLFSDNPRDVDTHEAAATATNTFEAASDFVFRDHFRDGSSDSDTSAVLNDAGPGYDIACAQRLMTNDMSPHLAVKVEEHNFFGDETTCHFFSDEQAPTLQSWYCSGEEQQWSLEREREQ